MAIIYPLWATFLNELRRLLRDRTGLLLLFIMPAALVIVLTLVQEPLFKQEKGARLKGLVVDQDGGRAAQAMIATLKESGGVSITQIIDGHPMDETSARKAVTKGQYQFCVVLPPALSSTLDHRITQQIDAALASSDHGPLPTSPLPSVTVWYDPAIRDGYRAVVAGAVQQSVAAVEIKHKMDRLMDVLGRLFQSMGRSAQAPASTPALAAPRLDFMGERLVAITENNSGLKKRELPTAVQQNVPAWALFGMFFIVVPLSGALIRERREGIFDRLMTMPVSQLVLILGKLGAYTCVCLLQFACVLMIGKWLLPLMGTDSLVLGHGIVPMAMVVACSALAATGYGVMIGCLARTHEQAGVLGPVSVVIASALGGIMVPVFAMPQVMQTISRFSPLAWAHGALVVLMVKEGSWADIAGRMILLLLFFAATLLIAAMTMRRHQYYR